MKILKYLILALIILNLPNIAHDFSITLGALLSQGTIIFLVIYYFLKERQHQIHGYL